MTPKGTTDDAVPEADRHEGSTPSEPDLRFSHVHSSERPEADVLEQEISVVEVGELPTGVDAARLELIDEVERAHEETGR